jgi:small subunit ribosomal protein S2
MADQFIKEMLGAGVHFGHLTRKWNPSMAPYIFMERNGIHIIDLYKTQAKLEQAGEAMAKIVASGRKILFVATKKQAKEIIEKNAGGINMPYITERWPGGMLTNFVTIRKAIKKMQNIDRMKEDGSYKTLSKRERLQVDRQRTKLERELGSIADMTRLPAALFIVDITKEHIAVKEAKKLGIPVFAIVDTNSDPNQVEYAIPGNDDATKSIDIMVTKVTDFLRAGLQERAAEKNKAKDAKIKKAAAKTETTEEATATEAAPVVAETAAVVEAAAVVEDAPKAAEASADSTEVKEA